jgi:hypothetical protein
MVETRKRPDRNLESIQDGNDLIRFTTFRIRLKE